MLKIATGFIALAGVALVTPALAQGVYFDAPGVSVGVGARHHWNDWDRPYYRGYGVRTYDDSYAYAGGCRTVKIYRGDGSVKIIRRCR
jgi:hypothetical protein